MAYQIEYAYTSHIGKLRANNEDNFWCCGAYMDAENQGTEGVKKGKISLEGSPLFGVFDGMGGESSGEIAAYLAAEACGRYYEQNTSQLELGPEDFLTDMCHNMNHAVCDYADKNRITSMGSTAVLAGFCHEGVFVCNLGDSPIYHLRGEELLRLSTDHVVQGITFGKAPLTQFLGIPDESMLIEPSLAKAECRAGDRYLLCSDGVTDMLSGEEIREMMGKGNVEEAVEGLLELALKKGGRDNITMILCEISLKGPMDHIRRWLERRKKEK